MPPYDPNALAQDKDFLSAAPEDQIGYLSSVDPDFAKASHDDQLGYIQHLTGHYPTPAVPKPSNPIMSAAEQGGLMTGPQTTGVSGAEQAVARTASAMNPLHAVSGLAHIFDAPSQDEKEAYKGRIELSPYARPLLASERMLGQPIVTAARAYGPGNTQEKDMVNKADLPEVLPEALGSSTTQYFGGKAVGELVDKVLPKGGEATPTPTRTTMLSRALRPGGKAAKNFPQNVQNAYPAIQDEIAQNGGQVPTSLGDFSNMLSAARKRIWGNVQDLLNKAQSQRPPVKGLLQSAPGSVQTGVQQVAGEAAGGVIPAESRPIVQPGPPAELQMAARVDKGIGSTAASVPERIMGQQPAVGAQAAAIPDSVMGPKTVQSEQFLSGSEHPEMSGQLTNPATLVTRDLSALKATRDRLATVVNSDQFAQLGPAEQEAYSAQLNRLSKLLEAPKDVPHGPAIDGNLVADAIEKSARPRPKLFGQTDEIQARANAYRGRRIPLTDSEELLQDANREASAWYLARDPHGPQLQASAAAEGSSIRDQLYRQIDQLTKSDPGKYGQLKKTYGALEALQDFTNKRIPVVTRQAPINLLEGGAGIAGVIELMNHLHDWKGAAAAPLPWLAAKGVRYINSPEFLLKQSLKQPANVPAPIRAAAIGTARVAPLAQKKEQNK